VAAVFQYPYSHKLGIRIPQKTRSRVGPDNRILQKRVNKNSSTNVSTLNLLIR
jgi:hypothetical protein